MDLGRALHQTLKCFCMMVSFQKKTPIAAPSGKCRFATQWRIQGARPPTDQNFLNFIHFFGKFVYWRLPMEGWRPLL